MPSPIVNVGLKGGLITGGLGRPACQGMITMLPFQLGCFVFVPPPPPPPPAQGLGGSIPLEPGEIHDLYQPVGDADIGKFADPSVYGKRHVKVIFKSKFVNTDKEFLIPEKRLRTVIKAINIYNRTKDQIKTRFDKLRMKATGAVIRMKNFRKRS